MHAKTPRRSPQYQSLARPVPFPYAQCLPISRYEPWLIAMIRCIPPETSVAVAKTMNLQGASAIRNLLIRNVEARSAISWLGNRDPQLPRGHFRPLGSSPEKCERFLKFSVFSFSSFSPEVRTILVNFEFSTFRSEEIGHPQRVSRVRKSGSRANSEVSYQTGDLCRESLKRVVGRASDKFNAPNLTRTKITVRA